MMTTQKPLSEADFIAGVALMDDMLRAADREANIDATNDDAFQGFWIDARIRGGVDLNFYLREHVRRLVERPELVDGFCAALGDYLGSNNAGLACANGAVYEGLSYDDIMKPDTTLLEERRREDASNVVSFSAAAACRQRS